MTTAPPRQSGSALLELAGLEKRFDNEFCLTDVDISVGENEVVALLGPSGCGKTTILRCIAGVETPDSGTIRIAGDLVSGPGVSKPPEKREVGMVYQNYAIWPHKTVYENVVFPLEHSDHDIPKSQYEARVEAVLEMVEIDGYKNEPATDLSGGQQQRTALARSIVHDPDLLLMDEPLSNLDKGLRRNMRYELQRLQQEIGFSMLYVTHNQQEAFYLSDRVLLVQDGKILERGTPQELYSRPAEPFTREFVGNHNRFAGEIHETADGELVVESDVASLPVRAIDHVPEDVTTGPVACFLSPEDLHVGRFGPEGHGVLELTGRVVALGLLDQRYEIMLELSNTDTTLTVHSEKEPYFERGDDINVHARPKDIQIYAHESV